MAVKPPSILIEAESLVNGDRAKSYGPAREDWQRAVDIFYAWTGIRLTPEQGIKFLICVKQSREQHKHKRDNLTDVCGYSEVLNWLEEDDHA